MSDDLTITGAEVEALAAKLEGLDSLSDRELTVLHSIFALAGEAAVDHQAQDVAGFMPTAVENLSINFAKGGPIDAILNGPALDRGGLKGSFSWGMSGGGGGAGKLHGGGGGAG